MRFAASTYRRIGARSSGRLCTGCLELREFLAAMSCNPISNYALNPDFTPGERPGDRFRTALARLRAIVTRNRLPFTALNVALVPGICSEDDKDFCVGQMGRNHEGKLSYAWKQCGASALQFALQNAAYVQRPKLRPAFHAPYARRLIEMGATLSVQQLARVERDPNVMVLLRKRKQLLGYVIELLNATRNRAALPGYEDRAVCPELVSVICWWVTGTDAVLDAAIVQVK